MYNAYAIQVLSSAYFSKQFKLKHFLPPVFFFSLLIFYNSHSTTTTYSNKFTQTHTISVEIQNYLNT